MFYFGRRLFSNLNFSTGLFKEDSRKGAEAQRKEKEKSLTRRHIGTELTTEEEGESKAIVRK